jgi:hypothetical protein
MSTVKYFIILCISSLKSSMEDKKVLEKMAEEIREIKER